MLDFVQTQLKQLNGMKGALGVEVSCMCNELNILFDELLGISEEINRCSDEEGIKGIGYYKDRIRRV